MKFTSVKNPVWANQENTVIECVVNFDGLGEVPFGASLSDGYEHSIEIFNRCASGEFGTVGEYISQPPQPAFVPFDVSPRQIRMALTRVDLRAAVETAVAAGDQDIKDWWEFSTSFERSNTQVEIMATVLGVSSEQLDQLWNLAATL